MLKIKISKDEENQKQNLKTNSRVKYLLSEVKIELLKAVLINTFLDSIMAFFIVYFIVSFFDLPFIYILGVPGAITFFFFMICLIKRTKKLKLKVMEDANPQISEMLRTANDNKSQENVMALALFEDLRRKMKTTSAGNLLEGKKIFVRIISAIVIVFLIIFVSSLNINMEKIKINFGSFKLPFTQSEPIEGNLTELVFNETDVMFGDADVARLGNDRINLNVNPSLSEIDFNKISDAEDQALREGGVPEEIGITADAFDNNEVLDEAEQAANYSQRIKNI